MVYGLLEESTPTCNDPYTLLVILDCATRAIFVEESDLAAYSIQPTLDLLESLIFIVAYLLLDGVVNFVKPPIFQLNVF